MAECPYQEKNQYSDEEIQREVEYEKVFYQLGIERADREYRKGVQEGRLAEMPVGKKVIRQTIGEVAKGITAIQEEKTRGVSARYRGHLRKLDAETLAFIALRTVLIAGSLEEDKPKKLQSILQTIGTAIETEIMAKALQEAKPYYVARIEEQIKTQCVTDTRTIRAKYSTAYRDIGYDYEPWNINEKAQTAKLVLNVLWELGLFTWKKAPHKEALLELNSDLKEFIESSYNHIRPIITHPVMLVKPMKWLNYWSGGYFTTELRKTSPMMKIRHLPKEYRRWVLERLGCAGDAEVRRAMNKAQETPYRVNKRVLEVARTAFADPRGLLGLPPHGPRPKPPFPFSESWDSDSASEEELEQFTIWKKNMKDWYTYEATRSGRKAGLAGRLNYLAEIADEERWYCPVFIDWRGRLYFRSTINPQSADVIKGCIDFAEGKPLGADGLYWLKFQVANCCGYDKKDPDLRVQWCDEHWEEIKAFLHDPLNLDPPEPDTAFTLLQAGYALEEALASPNPEEYICHVPVALDATCSGLQHYSAMFRDEVGGRYTNLIDDGQDEKHDIYRAVAEKAVEVLPTKTSDETILNWWNAFGIPRVMAKRPVMTYVYSATMRSCIDYVSDYLVEQEVEVPEGYSHMHFCTPIGKALREAVEVTVPKAKEGMDFLKSLVRAKPDEPVRWITPIGVPVVNYSPSVDTYRIFLRSMGVQVVLFNDYTDKYNRMKALSGISPNFIHSMDSSHLMKVINSFNGDILPIHDSFGTHPSTVRDLRTVLLSEFVKLYSEEDQYNRIVRASDISTEVQPPAHGSLRLESVLDSRYAFC